MLHLILLGSLTLLAGHALAEEVIISPLPPTDVAEPASATTSYSAPVREHPITIPAPGNIDRQIVAKEIELLRRTLGDTARSKSLFNLFSSPSLPIDGELLQEADRLIQRHSGMPETAEVFHIKAQVHQRMDNPAAAALDWLMLMVTHPDASFAAEAEKRLGALSGDQLKKQASLLREMILRAKNLNGDRDYRVATFLNSVARTSNEPSFAAPLMDECAAFLMRNTAWQNEDDIEYDLARQAMLVDHQVAIYHFDKLLALYPDSPFRPDSLLSIATAQRRGQHAYERAEQTFKRLIEQYPDTPETVQAYESLAAMYDEDMHDYPDSVRTYDVIVEKYREGPVVLRALNNEALIYQNRMNQPERAVDSYLRIAGIFRGPEVLDALNKAEKLAQYHLHDWHLAIGINDRIIAYAPHGDEAAKAMFANAEIAEDKLKDKRLARALYEKLIADQPNHPLAKDARKRIDTMENR